MQIKWALGSITMNKASEGDEIPAELLENSAVATELEKVSFHSNAKQCSSYCKITLISQASKVMLKILQARLQQCVN